MEQVLLTGASGFFGKHIKEKLNYVDGLMAPSSKELNLLDYQQTSDYLLEKSPKTIIHAAGFVGGIGFNTTFPSKMITHNLRMGLNLLEVASQLPNIHVVIVSTVCVYPEKAAVPTPETAMFEGYPAPDTAPYGIAKRALWTIAQSLAIEGKLSFSYVMPTNLYGPFDHFDKERSHVVAALVRRACEAVENNDQDFVIWGDGSSTRDFLYIEDAAEAIVLCAQKRLEGLTINLSSNRETSIKELAETICTITGFKGNLVWDTTRPIGAPRRSLNGEKAREKLGFVANTPLYEGLSKTISWYKQAVRDGVVV